jgi:hypothetical protein
VALQFTNEMQSKAINSWETSNSQALPVLGVRVVFIDKSTLSPKPKDETERAVEDIRSIVLSLSPRKKAVHIASLGDIFASRPEDGVGRLREVVGMIGNETERDDFSSALAYAFVAEGASFQCLCTLFVSYKSFYLHALSRCLSFCTYICSDCIGEWLHQDYAGIMCFWDSMPCVVCNHEGM